MRLAKVDHGRVGRLACVSEEDGAGVDGAAVVRDHPSRKVDVGVACELEGHGTVHAHGRRDQRLGARRRERAAAHEHRRLAQEHAPAGRQVAEDKRHRVEVGGRRAERDEHVHVGRSVLERLVRAAVEAAAKDELHGRRKQPQGQRLVRQAVRHLQPQRRRVCARKHRQNHRDDEHRQREHHRERKRHKPLSRLLGMRVGARLCRRGVFGLAVALRHAVHGRRGGGEAPLGHDAHKLLHAADREVGLHLGRMGHQRHRRALHAAHALERLLHLQ